MPATQLPLAQGRAAATGALRVTAPAGLVLAPAQATGAPPEPDPVAFLDTFETDTRSNYAFGYGTAYDAGAKAVRATGVDPWGELIDPGVAIGEGEVSYDATIANFGGVLEMYLKRTTDPDTLSAIDGLECWYDRDLGLLEIYTIRDGIWDDPLVGTPIGYLPPGTYRMVFRLVGAIATAEIRTIGGALVGEVSYELAGDWLTRFGPERVLPASWTVLSNPSWTFDNFAVNEMDTGPAWRGTSLALTSPTGIAASPAVATSSAAMAPRAAANLTLNASAASAGTAGVAVAAALELAAAATSTASGALTVPALLPLAPAAAVVSSTGRLRVYRLAPPTRRTFVGTRPGGVRAAPGAGRVTQPKAGRVLSPTTD